ncbi:MAG: hypothetical protein ABW005_10145 [Burkholderiaceae bacterium]
MTSSSSPPLSPIAALRPVLAWQRPADAPLPQPGELLRLRVAPGPQGTLLAEDGRGLSLPLPALPTGGGEGLGIGDLLLLRVLATLPQLELQLVERQPAQRWVLADSRDEAEPASMRAEQAWLARLQAGRRDGPPGGMVAGTEVAAAAEIAADIAAMALQWRKQVMTQLWRASRAAAPAPLAGNPAGPGALALPASIALPGWNAQALLLRLLSLQPAWQRVWHLGDEEADEDAAAAEEQGLRLSLALQFNGAPLQLLLQWHRGLLLYFSTEQAANLALLRARLPRVAAALAAVPLPLRHCQLALRPPLIGAATPEQLTQGLRQGSSGALFRAAAEIVHALQSA